MRLRLEKHDMDKFRDAVYVMMSVFKLAAALRKKVATLAH